MIKVTTQKVFKITLEITDKEEFYTVCNNQLLETEKGNNFTYTDDIFKWIKENTRNLVPFKKVGRPSFRLIRQRDSNILLVVEWDLSDEEITFL